VGRDETRRGRAGLATRAGPFEQLTGGAAVWRRTNPFYGLDEDRGEVWLGVSRDLVPGLRAEVHGSMSEVRFGSIDDRAGLFGATLTYDTRIEPSFPRNAVLLSAGWDVLDSRQYGTVGRVRADLRGFVGLLRQSVLCLRIQYAGAGGALPAYERVLVAERARCGPSAGQLLGRQPRRRDGGAADPLSSPFSIGRMD